MPRNSTGNYTLPLPPVVSGELIEAPWANTSLDDIGQALTDSLDRYGRGGMLAAFLFADGTLMNPGAAWANAPGTGFFRDSAHLGFVWNGAEQASFNENGMSGKINSMRVVGTLNVDTDAALTFDGEDTTIKWRLQLHGAIPDDSIGFWNEGTGLFQLKLDTSGSSFFGGACGATGFQTNGDWSGIQFYDSNSTKAGEIFGRADGGITLYAYDSNGANQNVIDFLSTGMNIVAPVIRNVSGAGAWSTVLTIENAATQPIWMLYDTRNNGQGIAFNDTNVMVKVGGGADYVFGAGNANFNKHLAVAEYVTAFATSDTNRHADIGVNNSAGWPGLKFYWGGYYERNMMMDQQGTIYINQTENVSNGRNFAIYANGSTRATQFVATPTP